MNASDARELFAYDRWANGQVLAVAKALGEARLGSSSSASHGSVFGTLVHILWAEWIWLTRWTPSVAAPDPRPAAGLTDLTDRWSAFEAEQKVFLDGLSDADLAREVSYVSQANGATWTYSLQHMLQHVVNHGTLHRGQLTTLFRESGVAARPLDFLVYFDEVGAGER